MQVNLDGEDDDKPVNQKVAQVIKEGYMMKKKPVQQMQDMQRTWERGTSSCTTTASSIYDKRQKTVVHHI